MDSLCTLPLHPLHVIVQQLSLSDRIRLSRTCHRLQQVCNDSVQQVRVSQEDLEEWGGTALSAYSNARCLQLSSVTLDLDFAAALTDTAPQLLQHLTQLQISNPVRLDVQGLALVLQSCPNLKVLHTHGSWGSGEPGGAQLQWEQHPLLLQQLSIQHNSSMLPVELHAMLQGSRAQCAAPGQCDVRQQQRATSSNQQPSWSIQLCKQLRDSSLEGGRVGESSSSGCNSTFDNDCNTGGCNSSGGCYSSKGVECQVDWSGLTSLDLSGCHQLGGSWLFLGLCPRLISVSLHSCYKVTNSTVEAFRQTVEATMACSSSSSTHDSKSLTVADDTEGPDCVNGGTRFTAMHYSASTPVAPALQQLDLSYTRINDAAMPHLVAALPKLSCLALKGCNVGDDGLQHLVQLQHLTALHIKHCHRVTEEGIQALSTLRQLRSLSYGYTSMPEADDVAVAIAKQFQWLTALDLLASELTDAGLANLGQLSKLQQLKLYQAGVTEKGLALLASRPAGTGLQSLVLYGIGGLRELACLGGFRDLQQVQLGSLCDLTSVQDSLQQLTAVQELRQLTLERMDGIHVDALQQIMATCHKLHHLRVRGCDGVSQEDMEEVAQDAAAMCSSSACLWWAASPSCDTDDEEEGWQLLPP